MLLSLLISTASANEAPTPAVEAPTKVPSLWTAPPQLAEREGQALGQIQMYSAVAASAALGAATLSAMTFQSSRDADFNRDLARLNAVAFGSTGVLLGALSLLPAIQLANHGVRWAPSLGVASMALGLTSLVIAADSRDGGMPADSVFLAAGLAWASPILALSEVLLSSRAGWKQSGSKVTFRLIPTYQGGSATMTWRF